MTDARFPDRWLNDRRYMSLSAPDFRAFVCTLVWSVASRTDGLIRHEDVPLMAWMTPDTMPRLVANNVLVPVDEGWLIDGFAVTQTTRKELQALDAKRAADAERKRAERLAKKLAELAALESAGGQGVPPDVHTDVPTDTPRPRTRTRPLPEQPLSQRRSPAAESSSLPEDQGDHSNRDQCIADGCESSPRHHLRTCFDHASLELAR